ncbi:MAG TPA: hypothetical protein VMR46_01045 [Candidatus Paceibacterota bacterium]|nr:hypothetical protein [Candidatus Paceibacterota bacterium]
MQNRAHSGKLSLVLLFVCIFAFWWGIAVLTQNNTGAPNAQPTANAASVASIPQEVSGPVAVQVSFANNTYTYSGTVPLASPCDQLGEGIAINGKDPSYVTVLLTLMKQPGICKATSGDTNEPFSVSVSVASGTKAVLNGLTVNGIITPTAIQQVSAE